MFRPHRLHPSVSAIVPLALLLVMPATAAAAPPWPTPRLPGACDVLTRDLVFSALDARPPEAAVEVTDHDWECTYSWMAEGAQTVVIFQIHEVGPDGAAAQYRASTQMMRRQEHQDLDDVGDEAVWFPAQRLITAREDETLVSLHVNVVHLGDDGITPMPSSDVLQIGRGLAADLLARMR